MDLQSDNLEPLKSADQQRVEDLLRAYRGEDSANPTPVETIAAVIVAELDDE